MSRQGRKGLTKANLELFLNDLFLRNGLYRNISAGQLDFYFNDLSLMVPAESVEPDLRFPDNMVFQSAFKNWVYESGIPTPASGVAIPTVASGVTVNGTFYPEDSWAPGFVAGFSHKIDRRHGRVIFDAPIAAGSTVQANFAYKEVGVYFSDKKENERKAVIIETSLKDNPRATGVDIYPSSKSNTLPGVWIDFTRRESNGYELGSKSLVGDFFGVFHIWASDDYWRDVVEDILAEEQRTVILGINFNTAPFPLLSRNQKNPNYPGYSNLAQVWGQHFWRRIYLDVVSMVEEPSLFDIERSRGDFNIRVYPNF